MADDEDPGKPVLETLESGDQVWTHPNGDQHLVPPTDLHDHLMSIMDDNKAAAEAIRQAHVTRVEAKQASLHAHPRVPHEKRVV